MFAVKWLFGVWIIFICVATSNSHIKTWHTPHTEPRTPSEVMVDVINNLGLNILKMHNVNNENNIALSPYGVASILTALLEGVRGRAALEIQQCGGFPSDKDVIRVGLRDIHRLLRSYFIPQEGFLSGLSLSSEQVTLKPDYQSVLRFYGFDMTSFNTPIYPDISTTTSTSNITDEPTTIPVNITTETAPTAVTEENITQMDDITTTTIATTVPAVTTEETAETRVVTMTELPETTTPVSETTSAIKLTTFPETTTLLTETTEITTPVAKTTEITTPIAETTITERTTTIAETTITVGTTIAETTQITTVTVNNEIETSTIAATTLVTETTTNVPEISTTPVAETILVPEKRAVKTPETLANLEEASTTPLVDDLEGTTNLVKRSVSDFGGLNTEMISIEIGDSLTKMADATLAPSVGDLEAKLENQMERSINIANSTKMEDATKNMASATKNMVEHTKYMEDATLTTLIEAQSQNRTKRSIIDYVIARYYDGHNSDIFPPQEVETEKYSFLVGGTFHEKNVHFMTYDVVLPFFYISNLNALALKFPLDSPKYYLLLVLPVEAQGIDSLICEIGKTASLKQIVSHMRPTYVRAIIPSFMLRGFVILTSSLQKIGIRAIFEPNHSDFSPMTEDKDIYVTNIEQAITVMIKNYMDPNMLTKNRNLYQYGPVDFKATHPFLYFVMDSEIDVTLVAGKIVNPINSRIQ